MRFILCLFVVFANAVALIEWPFEGSDGVRLLNITVGTPGQSLQVELSIGNGKLGLFLPIPYIDEKGFDFKKSSTFKFIENYYDDGMLAMSGTDNLVIPTREKRTILNGMPVNVVGKLINQNGWLNLAPLGENDNSLLGHLLREEKEKTAVLVYDKIGSTHDDQTSGTLTLGGLPTQCSRQWKMMPKVAVEHVEEQWAFKVDGMKIGKSRHDKPFFASFSNDVSYFQLGEALLGALQKELKVRVDDMLVPCNSTKQILFTVGEKELVLEPKDYVGEKLQMYMAEDFGHNEEWHNEEKRWYERNRGFCYFKGSMSGDTDYAVLPISMLQNQCLLLDLKNKQIGLADRVKTKRA